MEINEREYEAEFNRLSLRLGEEFASECGFQNMRNYLRGLLGTAERKNGWQMAEYLGESTPYSIQQFIYRGKYSADGLRDDLRDYVAENIGDEDGVCVLDETGF